MLFQSNRSLILASVSITGLALMAGSAYADQIFVVDAMNDFNSTTRGGRAISPYNDLDGAQTSDLSTGGDSAAGLTGTLFVTSTGWFEEQNLKSEALGGPPVTGTAASRNYTVFNGDYAGDVNGVGSIATWTASGYAPGTSVDVYLHYQHQGNYADEAPYTLSGTAGGLIDGRTAPLDDLVLNDGLKDFNFELLTTAVADGSGNVELTVAGDDSWFSIDAAAFVGAASPVLPADFDGDGFVTNADIAIGISNFTGPQTDPPTFTKDGTSGDTDGDGDDDNGDLATVISAFTGPGPAPVPEPASLALLGLGGLLIARRRRA